MPKLPKVVMDYFREQGRLGGKKGAAKTNKLLGKQGLRARAMAGVAARAKKRAEKKSENS